MHARSFAALVCAFLIMGGLASARAEAPPASAYGSLPSISDAAISPDGSKIALAQNIGPDSFVWVLKVDPAGTVARAQIASNSKLRGVGWADDDLVTITISRALTADQATASGWEREGNQHYFEYVRTGAYSLSRNKFNYLLAREDMSWALSNLASVVAPIEGDPGYGRIFAPTSAEARQDTAVWRVNLKTGEGRTSQLLPWNTWDVLLNAKGQAVVRSESNEVSNTWRVVSRKSDGSWGAIDEGDSFTGAPPALLGLLPDGRLVTARSDSEGAELSRLIAVDLATGAKQVLFSKPPFDIEGVILDPWTHVVVGAEWIDDEGPQQHFFDADLDAIQKKLAGLDLGLQIKSWSTDRKRIITYEDARSSGTFYLYDVKTNDLMGVAQAYPDLPDAAIGDTSIIQYPARDKTRITAYFTTPKGAGKKLPAILMPHGGPEARDSAAFDWWAHFLASRGYAVIQPNFRGSDGYGRKWAEAGYGEWGGLMQRDIEDSVTALAKAGVIDPQRVCIIGASYGGYAALAGATLTPNLYKCAASVGGVADLRAFLVGRIEATGSKSNVADYWQRSIGRRTDKAAIEAVSPFQHADAVGVPVLLIHGAEDSVVPVEQSRTMAKRLKALGKDVTYVELPGDDHWLSTGPTRTRLLEEVERFLAKNLPVEPQKSGSATQ